MSETRWVLLKAVEENWGLMGPGDWNKVQWDVFCDGSYEVISTFNLADGVSSENKESVQQKMTTGTMDSEIFSQLQDAIKQEPWRDPSLESYACDGTAWEIESYRADGSIENTSGKLGYIYGHRSLERIASLLPPDDENIYDSAAFISVKKID